MLDRIRELSRSLLDRTDYPVGACGISFGGPVDFEHQRVTSVHSPGWKNFSFAEWVGANLNLPCLIDNDANAGALGEFRYGAGRGTESMVYVTLSTGVGAGLILNGKTYRGKDGLAGELGHVPISDSGITCSCGAVGCLESFCSGSAIAERGKEWGRRRMDGLTRIVRLERWKAREYYCKGNRAGGLRGRHGCASHRPRSCSLACTRFADGHPDSEPGQNYPWRWTDFGGPSSARSPASVSGGARLANDWLFDRDCYRRAWDLLASAWRGSDGA